MGTGLDQVTFPGVGFIRGNISWKRLLIAIFSYKAISFFSISQPLIFLKFCLSGRDVTEIGTLLDSVTFPGIWPLRRNIS